MNKLDLNPQFRQALAEIDQGKHVFVTGRAGTGKSTRLQYFRQRSQKNMAVLAPTGVAAVNIGGRLEIVYLKTNDQKSRRVIEPKKVGKMKYLGKSFLGVGAFDHLRGQDRLSLQKSGL